MREIFFSVFSCPSLSFSPPLLVFWSFSVVYWSGWSSERLAIDDSLYWPGWSELAPNRRLLMRLGVAIFLVPAPSPNLIVHFVLPISLLRRRIAVGFRLQPILLYSPPPIIFFCFKNSLFIIGITLLLTVISDGKTVFVQFNHVLRWLLLCMFPFD